LGFVALPDPRQLGQDSEPRLIGPPQHPILLGLVSLPKYNGFGLQPNPRLLGLSFKKCPKLLGFWVPHLRGTDFNLGKFIVIINIYVL